METTVFEMKNLIDGFNRSDAVRKKITECEIREMETVYTEAQEEIKTWEKIVRTSVICGTLVSSLTNVYLASGMERKGERAISRKKIYLKT